MIKVEMTIREMMNIIALMGTGSDLVERIICALESSTGTNQRRMVTVTGGMNTDNRISCIKAIRMATGWGLRESKEWTDKVVGHYNYSGNWEMGGGKGSITAKTPEAAELLLRDLTNVGCEGYLS
jgi:hypothetical protein